jgi:hypothetical protein
MKAILRTLFAASLVVLATACALLQPMKIDDQARRAAHITLTAYEALQQAVLIYGRLPTCDAEAELIRLCKDSSLWRRIKIVEAAATKTIAEATPVLNGQTVDSGQLVAAAIAIAEVKSAISAAQSRLKEAEQ